VKKTEQQRGPILPSKNGNNLKYKIHYYYSMR